MYRPTIHRICVFFCVAIWWHASSVQAQEDRSQAADPPENPAATAIELPSGMLDGGTEWLNCSEPIDLKDLRGKVVLLDFWTYCCINCIHVMPDLKYLEDKYGDQLVVIGVHSAKFDNEKDSKNIRDAILRYEIKHPVVNDSNMTIWNRFGARSWPTLALIDPEGKFVGKQGGEGHRELFDDIIGRLVKYHRWKGTLNEKPMKFDLESSDDQPSFLRYPGKVLYDINSDRLFVSDSNHNRIIVAKLTGEVLAVIGKGTMGADDGDYATATFDHPQGMDLVGQTLYVADTENHLIRAVDLETQQVTTLMGTGKQGRPGNVDGRLKQTSLNSPWALCHSGQTLFIAMAGPHQIWSHQLGSGRVGVYAGNAREDVINGSLSASSFAQPSGLTMGPQKKVFFVADSEGSAIRKVPVDRAGRVETIAGTSELERGQSLFAFGDVDGVQADARFQHPLGVAYHDGAIFVADTYNHKIRKVDAKTGQVTTWLGDGESGRDLGQFNEPSGLAIAGEFLIVADTNNHRILKVGLNDKSIEVLAFSEPKASEQSDDETLNDKSTTSDVDCSEDQTTKAR